MIETLRSFKNMMNNITPRIERKNYYLIMVIETCNKNSKNKEGMLKNF